MTRYSSDPFWMSAKFASTSADGKPIRKGDRIFYYPNGRRAYVGETAEQHARDFEAALADEAFSTGEW